MFEKILIPYRFSEDDKKTIDANYHSSSDWSNSQLRPIKNKLKCYLRYLQDNKCCYCRQELGFDYRQVDIEHIVDKKKHENFGFEIRNLALSCPACNSCKTDQKVLVDENITSYPTDSNKFLIVHPYYDNYSEHIYVNYPVYVSKSPKGDKTIQYCKLSRLHDVEMRQKEIMQKKMLVNALINTPVKPEDEENIFNAIAELIQLHDNDE